MAQSSSGFDMSKMSMGSKILLGSGVLLLIVSFFGGRNCACRSSALRTCGVAAAVFGLLGGLALVALIVWEGLPPGRGDGCRHRPAGVEDQRYLTRAAGSSSSFIFAYQRAGVGAFIG
jgi:hypothetical protein